MTSVPTARTAWRQIGALAFPVLVMIGVWILAVPPSGGPDEPSHVVRGAAVVRGQWHGEPIGSALDVFELPAHVGWPDPGCFAFQLDVPATCATALPVPDGDASRATKAADYPVWSHAVAGIGSLLPAPLAPIGTRAIDSLVPALLLAGALVAGARRGWSAVGGVLVAITVPVWFVVAVVNPSGYAIAGGIALWVGLVGPAVAPVRRPRPWTPSGLDRALVVGGWAALVLPRRDGLVYAVVVLTIAVVGFDIGARALWDGVRRWGRVVVAASTLAMVLWGLGSGTTGSSMLLAAPALPVAGFVVRRGWARWPSAGRRVLLVAAGLAGAGLASIAVMSRRADGVQLDVFQTVVGRTGADLDEVFGLIGWLDTPVPRSMVMLWLVALGVLVGTALLSGRRRHVVVAAAVVAVGVWMSWVLTMVQNDPSGTYWQGRYYLPLLAGVPIVLGLAPSPDRIRSSQAGRLVATGTLVIGTVGLAAGMRRWAVGVDGTMFPWRWDTYDTVLPPIVLLAVYAGASTWLWTRLGGLVEPVGDRPLGVNVVGYHHVASGLGEAARRMTASLREAGVPCVAVDVDLTESPQQRAVHGEPDTLHDVTVAVVTAAELPRVWARLPKVDAATRRLIGYWFWELAQVPESHRQIARLVDEVWTPTAFVEDAYRSALGPQGPTVRSAPLWLPEPVVDDERLAEWRAELAPAGEFVFLVSFDFFSVVERKNPTGAIDAFVAAFGDDPGRPVRLVVKTMNGHLRADDLQTLEDAAGIDPRIHVLDRCVDDADLRAMLAAADCYVSLHRGEGLGLHVADAMWLSTTVIATDYSGTADLVDGDAALMVAHSLVPVGGGGGAYPVDAVWAAPHVDSAAAHMRTAVTEPDTVARLRAVALDRMRRGPGPGAIGRSYRSAIMAGDVDDGRASADASGTIAPDPTTSPERDDQER